MKGMDRFPAASIAHALNVCFPAFNPEKCAALAHGIGSRPSIVQRKRGSSTPGEDRPKVSSVEVETDPGFPPTSISGAERSTVHS